MYRIIFALCVITFSTASNIPDGINSKASHIKDTYPEDYRNTIRKHAIEKWGEDYEMIIYEINKQADAIFNVIDKFESDNTNILYNAMVKWSHDEFESSTTKLFKELKIVDIKSLIKFHCDWEMVEYEYDKQSKARGAF